MGQAYHFETTIVDQRFYVLKQGGSLAFQGDKLVDHKQGYTALCEQAARVNEEFVR